MAENKIYSPSTSQCAPEPDHFTQGNPWGRANGVYVV